MVAVTLAFGKTPIACGQGCQRPDFRSRFGCDSATREPVWYLPCYECDGKPRDEPCKLCRGLARLPMHRCPSKSSSVEASEMLRAALAYGEGVLPNAGGLFDQSHAFVTLLPLVRSRIRVLEADRGKK